MKMLAFLFPEKPDDRTAADQKDNSDRNDDPCGIKGFCIGAAGFSGSRLSRSGLRDAGLSRNGFCGSGFCDTRLGGNRFRGIHTRLGLAGGPCQHFTANGTDLTGGGGGSRTGGVVGQLGNSFGFSDAAAGAGKGLHAFFLAGRLLGDLAVVPAVLFGDGLGFGGVAESTGEGLCAFFLAGGLLGDLTIVPAVGTACHADGAALAGDLPAGGIIMAVDCKKWTVLILNNVDSVPGFLTALI